MDSWPRMEKWFNRFGILKTVEAGQDEDQVCLEVEQLLEETLDKVRQ